MIQNCGLHSKFDSHGIIVSAVIVASIIVSAIIVASIIVWQAYASGGNKHAFLALTSWMQARQQRDPISRKKKIETKDDVVK